jgi:hypothetical protein
MNSAPKLAPRPTAAKPGNSNLGPVHPFSWRLRHAANTALLRIRNALRPRPSVDKDRRLILDFIAASHVTVLEIGAGDRAVIQQHSPSRVDVLKLDAAGRELFVLRDAASLLERPDAPVVLYGNADLTSNFGYHPVETMWLLQRYGYRFFMVGASGRITPLPGSPPRDTMLIAAKPGHPLYPSLAGRDR